VDDSTKRKNVTLRQDPKTGAGVKYPIYTDNDTISGNVHIKMDKAKKWEH